MISNVFKQQDKILLGVIPYFVVRNMNDEKLIITLKLIIENTKKIIIKEFKGSIDKDFKTHLKTLNSLI